MVAYFSIVNYLYPISEAACLTILNVNFGCKPWVADIRHYRTTLSPVSLTQNVASLVRKYVSHHLHFMKGISL